MAIDNKMAGIQLSKRLQAVAKMVTVGAVIADIGTDHAHIPIFLLQSGHHEQVLALDVNEGPLVIAQQNIIAAGLTKQIATRLSNGLEKLTPGEVDGVIIAGMGGALVQRILSQSWETVLALKEVILQPQSEISAVRSFLLTQGFSFEQEDMVYEKGQYYPIIKVIPPTVKPPLKEQSRAEWSQVQLQFGKLLLEQQHPVLQQFLQQNKKQLTAILQQLVTNNSPATVIRKQELTQQIKMIQEGLTYYAG